MNFVSSENAYAQSTFDNLERDFERQRAIQFFKIHKHPAVAICFKLQSRTISKDLVCFTCGPKIRAQSRVFNLHSLVFLTHFPKSHKRVLQLWSFRILKRLIHTERGVKYPPDLPCQILSHQKWRGNLWNSNFSPHPSNVLWRQTDPQLAISHPFFRKMSFLESKVAKYRFGSIAAKHRH